MKPVTRVTEGGRGKGGQRAVTRLPGRGPAEQKPFCSRNSSLVLIVPLGPGKQKQPWAKALGPSSGQGPGPGTWAKALGLGPGPGP